MMRLLFGLSFGSALVLSGCRQDGPAKPSEDIKPDTGDAGMADEDGDGWTVSTGDCDDNNAAINPGAEELCDGLDNDCDGSVDEDSVQVWYQDADGDGYGDAGVSQQNCEQPDGFIADATDCDDTDATIHPDADEDCNDPVDRNCDGSVGYADLDGDGSPACDDCDDTDAARSPEAQEICDANNVDEDCDGAADDADSSVDAATMSAWYTDADGDGYGDSALLTMACDGAGSPFDGDCNDADAAYNPGAPETDCADPNDYNCDGSVGYADTDGDGFAACEECDDGNAAVNPDGTEVCNGVDDDCNGLPDDNATDAAIWYADVDGDGYGDASAPVASCLQLPGTVGDATDCDDGAAGINPGAPEYCDGVDNDCDGTVDEDGLDPATWYTDADGDGYGDASSPVYSCTQPAGAVADDTDCDDGNAIVSPGAAEICDGIDNDCDGAVDDSPADASTWYLDADSDGYGDDGVTTAACTMPAGYASFGGDCDDSDPLFNPGAVELDCLDPNDYNCDGSTGYSDLDGDGFAACVECDDTDALNFPGADEYCDGVDNDCDGEVDNDALDASTWYLDSDVDGYGSPTATILACQYPAGYLADNTDCNDGVDSIHPGAPEYCDGIDQDCDGATDDGAIDQAAWYADADGDGYGDSGSLVMACSQPAGYGAVGGDCDDGDAAYNPGATEADCADPNDYNCDGVVAYRDGDGDSYAACEDCDDGDAAINAGAVEYCDGVDNNCDGQTDEDSAVDAPDWYADADGDSYGDAGSVRAACSQPAGYVGDSTDCNDGADTVYPGAAEICNSVDDDCDGAVDDNAIGAPTWYYDTDGDGYGGAVGVASCAQPVGTVANDDDCADSVAAINPAAAEVCDSLDNDCDGVIDTDAVDRATWYVDADGDGYGGSTTALSCTQPAGYVSAGGDCNDASAAVSPGDVEACNGVDDDCDGSTDEAGATGASTYYQDADGDSYGSATATTTACSQPPGYASNSTDCNDAAATIYPGAAEVCNSLDDDCDGAVDDGAVGLGTWYRDADSDGYGTSSNSTTSCSQPSGYVAGAGDCDDGAASVNPGAAEVCDSRDNDCDGAVDEGSVGTTWYRDADSDGYGTSATTQIACSQPSGYVGNATDCNDASAAISPAAVEACNGYDDDCDGSTDEAGATGGTTYYRDADSDGYGGTTTQSACTQPAGYVTTSTDCADSNAAINPGASELCNSLDDDCDGSVDEAGALGASTWYRDGDSDGYGGTTSTTSCAQPVGYVGTSTDCADSNAAINPGASELCNSVDDDCDGSVDEGTGTTWYRDADSDGYGSSANGTQVACTQPAGYVSSSTDCNDGLNTIYPGAAETCNSLDDDCDGAVDEGSIGTTWYYDADGDGYGTSATTVTACTQPSGYVSTSTDCADTISSINPAASDVCDTVDNDCDGYADNDGLCPCVVLYYNGHPYMFCTSTATWSAAQTACNSYGYDLASINDSAENTWLVDRGYTYYRGKWWTGGNDQATEGRWAWDSGEAWSYSNWHAGEPNNVGNEDCLQLGRFLDYTWNDEPCGTAFRYICEGN